MTFPSAAQLLLAAGSSGTTSNQPGGQGQEFGSSGPVALVLLIVLLVGTAFLVRSMSKHLKRVPASFDPPETPQQPPADPEDR
ncbi:MAG TPA: hypothetical protein VH352_11935 [Pseudonocardiaceae bacterium]|nr:hypothetical protein [Pseudonocardiaceae bacterium]